MHHLVDGPVVKLPVILIQDEAAGDEDGIGKQIHQTDWYDLPVKCLSSLTHLVAVVPRKEDEEGDQKEKLADDN
jgi:hypothetical protein